MINAATLRPETTPATDPASALVDAQLAILAQVAAAGVEIIEALKGQATGGPVVVQGDLALAYDRAARAVRHTLMLQSRLTQARREGEAEAAGRRAALQEGAARLVREIIEDDVRGDADGQDRQERLSGEAAERLRAEDFGDLFSRPFAKAVAGICRDLGLKPDWLALAKDCHAAEAAALGKAGKAPDPDPDDWDGKYEVRWLPSQPANSS